MRNENNETLEKHPSDAELPIWVVDLFGSLHTFANQQDICELLRIIENQILWRVLHFVVNLHQETFRHSSFILNKSVSNMKTMKLLRNMDKHTKNGLISMMCWILFLIVLYGTYSYVQDAPLKGLLDKETGGLISLAFFVVWALIWFAIGRHYSRDYEQKKEACRNQYPSVSDELLNKAFRDEYFSKIAKMLSCVFFFSVLAYVAANVREEVSTRNCIYIGVLMSLSILTYWYYKTHSIAKLN